MDTYYEIQFTHNGETVSITSFNLRPITIEQTAITMANELKSIGIEGIHVFEHARINVDEVAHDAVAYVKSKTNSHEIDPFEPLLRIYGMRIIKTDGKCVYIP